MSESTLSARPAAGGVAIGRIHLLEAHSSIPGAAVSTTLREAIETTLRELRALQLGLDPPAAEIVQFQVELLEDPELTKEAFAAVANGADPAAAFRDAIAIHLRVYDDAADEYLSARAADLKDLRDRVLRALSGHRRAATKALADGAILVADDLTPTAFLEIDWALAKGAATVQGSPSSHVAILARGRGIPLMVGLEGAANVREGTACILDADAGALILDPKPSTLARYREIADAAAARSQTDLDGARNPAVTRDGRAIRVYVNVDSPDSLRQAPREWFAGIGLTRTELLLDTSAGIPDAATQAICYGRLFEWSAGGPTTIRLFDAGADKPVPGLTLGHETNPYLGVRGIRLLLRKPEILSSQLAAILDAADGRLVRIMIPMVTIPEELASCREMLDALMRSRGTARGSVQLGMMVETPAAALTIERFEADFFSIGTNDLVQYVMAAGRDQRELGHLQSAASPAVLELIGRVARYGGATDKEVSVCGDAAFQPDTLGPLLRAGICSVSVPARYAPGVKSLIRTIAAGGS